MQRVTAADSTCRQGVIAVNTNVVVLILAPALAGVFIASAAAKFVNLPDFASSLSTYELPSAIRSTAFAIVPPLELALGLSLAFDVARPWNTLAILVVLLTFAAVLTMERSRRVPVRCGCFGSGALRIPPESAINRNLALGLAAVLVAVSEVPVASPALLPVIAAAALGTYLLSTFTETRLLITRRSPIP